MTLLPPGDDAAPSDVLRTIARGTGQTLITAALVILMFIAYELWWTGLTTRHDQQELLNTLGRQWSQSAAPPSGGTSTGSGHETAIRQPPNGSGIAILRIPRLGKSYKFVVVQGTTTADLIKGPGHYPGTAMPGQIGNFAVAGHRTTYLHPFYDINKLRTGDSIVVETRSTWFTYRVENIPGTSARFQEVVAPTDVSVAYAVPDQPKYGAVAKLAVLTLTSCNPRYSAAQRIVVHAVLTQVESKRAGLPPALAGDRLGGV